MFGSFERRVAVKKRYQIDREDAVRQFRKRAEQSEESLQLHLPLKEVAAALQEGVGHLMRQAGLELMQLIMDEEVRELTRRALPTPPNCQGRSKFGPLPRRDQEQPQSRSPSRNLKIA